MTGKCYGCSHFTAYYTKAYCCFLRTKCGHCNVLNQTVEKQGGCDNFKAKHYPAKIKRGAVLDELENVLTKLNGIKLILDERREDFNIIEQ